MAPIILSAPLEGWVTSLDAVPDPVFAGRMLGDGIAIDPVGKTLYAPCAGLILNVQPTGHAITIEAENSAQILLHIGIDTVALDGRGFTPLVSPGDRVASGDKLVAFDLDLLVREARAVVTPIVLTDGAGFALTMIASVGMIAAGAPLMTLARIATAEHPDDAPDGNARASESRTLRIDLPHGIHARPAARIAELARSTTAALTINKDGRTASARSPTGILGLGIGHGDDITLIAHGDHADAALDALVSLLSSGLGEPPVHSPSAVAQPPVPATTSARVEGALTGVCAALGLVVGPVRQHRTRDIEVPLHGGGVDIEKSAFATAHATLRKDISQQAALLHGTARDILAAHEALLDDPELVDATGAGIARGESAGHAWRAAIRQHVASLRSGTNARLAERADDLLDLERRLLALLVGDVSTRQSYPAGTILVADDLLPSDLMAISDGLVGLCIARGGPTSHVAILAASIGLPTLVAVGPDVLDLPEHVPVILDASKAMLLPNPDARQIAAAKAEQARVEGHRAAALAQANILCRTADGTRIEVFANLGAASEGAPAVASGAEGCGLLRTEFLFLDRETPPTIAEQQREYQKIADALEGRPLIIRLLDIGGDKPAPYLTMAAEENPALGLRGIRVGLAHETLLENQLRAILAVEPVDQCRIMLPMVAMIDEVHQVRLVLDRLRREIGITAHIALGIMVETPAAAITADILSREADFLSIGTNDLTQYTLAMDRTNPAVAGALDGLHPAVLRLIEQACRGAAMQGRLAGVCGGLASDPLAVPILLGLGVTELSVAPAMVPTIKACVREISIEACRQHAVAALACASPAEVRTLARCFASRETAA